MINITNIQSNDRFTIIIFYRSNYISLINFNKNILINFLILKYILIHLILHSIKYLKNNLYFLLTLTITLDLIWYSIFLTES